MQEFSVLPLRFFALTPLLRNSRDVTSIISACCELGSHLTPEVYGYSQPLLERFDRSRLVEMGKGIEQNRPLMVKVPSGRISLTNHIPGRRFGSVSIELPLAGFDATRISTMIRVLGAALRPVLGFVHVLNRHDRSGDIRHGMRKDASNGSSFGMFHRELAYGLPQFYWGMLFGAPYISLFGWEKLKNAPVAAISEVGGGSLYLQLTGDPADCEKDPEAISRARSRARKHLNPASFMHDRMDLTKSPPALPFFHRLLFRKRIVPRLVP